MAWLLGHYYSYLGVIFVSELSVLSDGNNFQDTIKDDCAKPKSVHVGQWSKIDLFKKSE